MRHPLVVTTLVSALAACAWSCSSDDTPGGTKAGSPPPKYAPATLPALGNVKTTLEETRVPRKARNASVDVSKSLSDPGVRTSLLASGYGDYDIGPGEKLTLRLPPGQTAPAVGANQKVLTRFVHLPDIQLADDESPSRVVRLDAAGATSGAYRPQESAECRVANAAVRTINALHRQTPFDFVLLGGDNIDSAMDNELDWVLDILSGAPSVECDSGSDDDLVEGAGNDGKDPFVAEGLKMPYYWVNGNHDVLVQGNFVVDDKYKRQALGASSPGGTLDWRSPGGVVSTDELVADAKRKHLTPSEVMAKVAAHKGGHGLGPAQAQSGRAFYTFDVPNTPIRFVALDTAAMTGAAEGVIRKSEIDAYVKPALDQAKNEKKLVVLTSHHAVGNIGDGTGLGGQNVDDAMTQDEYRTFIGGYDNVLFSIVGHSHEHKVRFQTPVTGHGWWEVMTSALADFPHQVRIIELIDDDNGFMRLRAVLADYATEGDPVAAEAKRLGVLDYTLGWCSEGSGTADDRNVELLIKKP